MLYDIAVMSAKIAGVLLLIAVARAVQMNMKAQAKVHRFKE